MQLYADGVRYIHRNDDRWMYLSQINIPHSTKVLAIKCESWGGQCGLSVILSNGVKTDTSWKCSDNEEDGWNTAGFDDKDWRNAKLSPSGGDLIWTTESLWSTGAIYCRKSISGPNSGSNRRVASYRQSSVVINSCDPSRYIETISTSRIMDCARACTKKADCKRYLYCSRNSSCNLYQDGRDCVMSGDTAGCSCYTQMIHCEGSNCTCPVGQYGEGCQDTISGKIKA
ncbi:hypothetical protein SNE40_017476 [Patella caerulea]|uniref:Uncharacterized protein n=1 Tax=Patella caerulea TaxID=87958 RepID=A0AAN8JC82_PATCE